MIAEPHHWARITAGMLGLIALQGAAVVALVQKRPFMVAVFVLVHGAASLGAAGLWHLLPARYRATPTRDTGDGGDRAGARPRRGHDRRHGPRDDWRRRWTRVILVEMALFMPVLGLAGFLIAALPALHRPRPRRVRTWRRVALPDVESSTQEIGAEALSVPSVPDVLRSADAPAGERMAALLALRALPATVAVPLLRVALCDRSEDVRLLAYAMLDRRDAALQARIRAHEAACEQTQGRTETTQHHHALAHLYWETAYTGLAQGAIKDQALDRAADHARAVIETSSQRGAAGSPETASPETPSTARCRASAWLLLGQIALARGAVDQARAALVKAQDLGLAATAVAPYLAEVAFLRRDFAAVRAHLQACARSGALAAVCGHWLSSSGPRPGDAVGHGPAGRVR